MILVQMHVMRAAENGQNHKGMITFDRKYKKDAFYAYKAWLSEDPFVHLCGKRYVDRVEEVTKITVYSNQPEVELFVNGVSLGRQTAPEHFFYFNVPNQGTSVLKAVAYGADGTAYCDESIINKVETFNEEYRLKEKGAVLNWFDITAPEGYFSLNDKMSDIMKAPEGIALFKSLMSNFGAGAEQAMAGEGMSESLMQMMGGFTVLRLIGLMGAANVKLTKEQLLEMNAMLNQIKKPE